MSKKKYPVYIFGTVIFILIMINKIIENKAQPEFTHNPELITIKPDSTWKGTPLDEKGRFTNLYQPFDSGFGDFLKWQWSKNPQKKAKKAEQRRLEVAFDSLVFQKSEDYLIWMGHATFLMQLNGKVILIDPLLFDNTFLKRESPMPFPIEQLPELDYLLISHNHRDHLDSKSIKYLFERNRNLKILTGLGIGSILGKWGKVQNIQEAGWFQQFNLSDTSLNITYVPSRHWSRRGMLDENKSLWGGFYIQNGSFSVYFMGDSGNGPHFQDISETLGYPDYCLMGVGAFKPEWFMSQAHISPIDAIEAFNVMQGKYFFPMHFGTFDLSDEPKMEPWDILLENKQKIEGELIMPLLGANLLTLRR